MTVPLATIVRDDGFILTEGAVVERLKNEFHLTLDDHINHAGFIYDAPDILATLYRQYIEIASSYHIPIMLMTPTRRVNRETLKRSAYAAKDVIPDCCAFLHRIREHYHEFSEHIFIGGLLGCKGNAYRGDEGLGHSEAYTFHKAQVTQFAGQGLDFLFAGIMPTLEESIGMAQAMAESDLPYIISFMIRKDGRLLDGTSIVEAIRTIDEAILPRPLCYMSNCVHPLNVKSALTSDINSDVLYRKRFIGIQANASPLSPQELDQLGMLHQGDFDDMIRDIQDLKNEFGFKIFGGCCGTNEQFIEKLARMLTKGQVGINQMPV